MRGISEMTNIHGLARYFFLLFVGAVYLFLYVPLLVLVVFSFNDSQLGFNWVGFTFRWYTMLWQSSEVWDALQNSLIVAVSSVTLSLGMASCFVFFGAKGHVRRLLVLFYANLVVPEIVLAVGLMSLFYFFAIPLSITTLIASHTVLGFGYAVPILYDNYRELDKRYMEASLDLGASAWQTFYLVVLPLLYPALLASALLVFIISFDDFLLSFFCSGGTTQTLPMYIFAMIRAGTSPVVSALSTVLLSASSILVLIYLSLHVKKSGVMR